MFFSAATGNLTLTTHLAGIWEGLMRHNAQRSAESYYTLQREKSHCCQQTRLTIWWGVNIFSVTACKHCFLHPSHPSPCTLLCIFMRPVLRGCEYFQLALLPEPEECADQGPQLSLLSWFLRLTAFPGIKVNRRTPFSCQCVCLPSGWYKLHHARPGAKRGLCWQLSSAFNICSPTHSAAGHI